MKEIDPATPVPFEDAPIENPSYTFYDNGNNLIIVNPPRVEKHTPHNGVPQDPAVHSNVGYAVNHSEERVLVRREEKDSDSENVVYKCHDFYEKINHPVRHTKPNYTLVVAVSYSKKADGKNYTKTFYDEPGFGEQ